MIYKLKYNSREEGLKDLKSKGIYNGNTEAIVEVGLCIDKEAVYNLEGEIIVEPVYKDCYCFDVMTDKVIDFDSIVYPKNIKHKFLGND